MELTQIRVDCSKGVSHYATKHYSVVHNAETKVDELVVDATSKVVAQVEAVNQYDRTIAYKAIEQ